MNRTRVQVYIPEGVLVELDNHYGYLDLPLSKLILLGLQEWMKLVRSN